MIGSAWWLADAAAIGSAPSATMAKAPTAVMDPGLAELIDWCSLAALMPWRQELPGEAAVGCAWPVAAAGAGASAR